MNAWLRSTTWLGCVCAIALAIGCGDDDGGGTIDGGRDGGTGDGGGMTTDGGGMTTEGGSGTDGGDVDSGPIDSGVPTTSVVWVGQNNGEVASFGLDVASGALTPRGTHGSGNNPSWVSLSPGGRIAVATSESMAEIVSLSVEPGTGALTRIDASGSEGGGPTHVAVDATGRWAIVANYGGGSVAVIPIGEDGTLAAAIDVENPGANPHQVVIDPSNRYVLVPCKGSDIVAQFTFDETTGALAPNGDASAHAGAGPRHMVLSPDLAHAWVVNENDSTVTHYDYDATSGNLTERATISTLPGSFSGTNTGAEIAVSPDGRFVYTSNRGHDSIAIFSVDASTGELTPVGHESTTGQTPRSFSLDPTGALLLVGNQRSDTIAIFRRDAAAGTLAHLDTVGTDAAPTFVGVFAIPLE